jgi:hypothetical protein
LIFWIGSFAKFNMADSSQGALFLHLFFVFLFIGAITVATILRFSAGFGGYQKPTEVATLLSLVRPLVAVVVLSLVLTVCFGFWTV